MGGCATVLATVGGCVFVSKENVRVTRALPLRGVSSYPDVLSARNTGGGEIQLTAPSWRDERHSSYSPRRAGIAQSPAAFMGRSLHGSRWLALLCLALARRAATLQVTASREARSARCLVRPPRHSMMAIRPPQFGQKEYWDEQYKQEKSFSWYTGWADLRPFWEEVIAPATAHRRHSVTPASHQRHTTCATCAGVPKQDGASAGAGCR